jgi:hypothetical protein
MNPEEYVGVRQSRVGRRELRGDPDRLREAFDTFGLVCSVFLFPKKRPGDRFGGLHAGPGKR